MSNTPDKDLGANPALLGAFVRAVATAGDSPTVIRRVVENAAYVKICRRLAILERDGEPPPLLVEACRKADITLPSLRARLAPVAKALGLVSEGDQAGYYRILGVPPDSDAKAIRSAYRRRARELHPDLQPDQGAELVEFAGVTEAYKTLRDPVARQAYDDRCRAERSWFEPDYQHPPPKPSRRYIFTAVVVVVMMVAAALVLDQLEQEPTQHIAFRTSRKVVTHPIAPPPQPVAPLDASNGLEAGAIPTVKVPLPKHPSPSQTSSAATAPLQAAAVEEGKITSPPTAPPSSTPESGLVPASPDEQRPPMGHEIPDVLPDDAADTDLALKEERAKPMVGSYDKRAAPPPAKAVQEEMTDALSDTGVGPAGPESVPKAPDNAPVAAKPAGRPAESAAGPENGPTPAATPDGTNTAPEVVPGKQTPEGDGEDPTAIPLTAFGRPIPAETGLPDTDLSEIAQTPEPKRRLDTAAALQPIPLEERLRAFIDAYCRAYESRDLARFRLFFAQNAVERGRSLETALQTYARHFEILDAIECDIELKDWENHGAADTVTLKGVFKFSYRLSGKGWQTSQGEISMDIMEIGSQFRIKRLDYEKE